MSNCIGSPRVSGRVEQAVLLAGEERQGVEIRLLVVAAAGCPLGATVESWVAGVPDEQLQVADLQRTPAARKLLPLGMRRKRLGLCHT